MANIIVSHDRGRRSLDLFWLALLFTGLALLQLGLVNNNLGPATFLPWLILVGSIGLVAYFLHYRQPPGDPILLPLVYFLSGLGLAMIMRLAPSFILRQLFWLAIATFLLLVVTLVPHNLDWLRRYKYTWLIGGLLLLASTLVFGVNPSGFGARLWLRIGTIFFQPSELLKLLLVVFLAGYLADRRYHLVMARAYIGRMAIPHPSYLGPMLLMWGFSIVLLIWQRDLGAALLFFGTFLGMLFVATGQFRYIWSGTVLLAVAGMIGYILFDVVRLRVDAFLNPWLDPLGRSFQIVQSLLALASGGVFGQGLGQGLPTAIPVVHTDFVFAAIGEEYGLLGAAGVLTCFALLVSRAFYIGLRAKSDFEHLLAVGIGTMLGLQSIVITAGTLKLMPLTGVTLPFVSYGGSSLITSFLMVGLLMFIARGEARAKKGDAPHPFRQHPPRVHVSRTTFPALRTTALARGLLTGFLIVAGGLILWQVVAASFLINRDDNPRLIIAEQKIERGRLLTRGGIPIAETISDEDDLALRHYPYPGLSSVTGYYSIRYGVGGTEAMFDPTLRGTVDQSQAKKTLDNLLHRPLVGRDVTLTIDLPAQVAADVAMGNREGAVVVMDIETGAILVMSSHPTYDPNTLDEAWNSLSRDEGGPLLNRATQGLFPVGDLARLIGWIGLYESGLTFPLQPLTTSLEKTLAPLGPTGYAATAHQLGLMRPLSGLGAQSGRLPDLAARETVRDLAVTPLHMARVIAALELAGHLPEPVLAVNSQPKQLRAFRSDTARSVRNWLPQVDQQTIGLWGEATPEETGQAWLSWFVGLAPATASQTLPDPSTTRPKQELILDPTKIKTPTPQPMPKASLNRAGYAVVAVVVTNMPGDKAATTIAKASLRVLLEAE